MYVAGPYTPEGGDMHDAVRQAHRNTLRAIDVALQLIEKGHVPFVPHLTHFIHMHSDKPLPAEFYKRYDMIWLAYCDALFFLGPSEGADRELAWARRNKLIIFKSLDQVPDAADSQGP